MIPRSAIHGVEIRPLDAHADERGDFTEIARQSWWPGVRPVQWSVVRSHAGVLRGLHVHVRHADLLLIGGGRAILGVRDLRRRSPSFGAVEMMDASAEEPTLIFIPPGVLHGFYFPLLAWHIYAMTEYWNPAEEMGCRWDDPAVGMSFPPGLEPAVSARDAALPPLSALLDQLQPHQARLA